MVAASDKDFLRAQLLNACKIYRELRTPNGLYRDKLSRNAKHKSHTVSIANAGVGLISLCIEDEMKFTPTATVKAQVLETLKLVNGKTAFKPPRSKNGFFRHFFDAKTAKGKSEFSTIDTAILMAGAIVAYNHFDSPTIRAQVKTLWNSIRWKDALSDRKTCKLHMVMSDTGKGSGTTGPFSEYILLAWYVYNDLELTGDFFSFYAPRGTLAKFEPKNSWDPLLSGPHRHSQSSFTIQFAYYLCAPCQTSATFRQHLLNQITAEKDFFRPHHKTYYGCGAGPGLKRYHADAIERNNDLIVSPYIIAGFLPLDPTATKTLRQLASDKRATATFAGVDCLWRFSLKHPQWVCPSLTGVDFSSALYGLAAAKENLGMDFFIKRCKFPF